MPRADPHAERDPPVGGGVGDRGDEQGRSRWRRVRPTRREAADTARGTRACWRPRHRTARTAAPCWPARRCPRMRRDRIERDGAGGKPARRRAIPLKSAIAVDTMSTLESGSSIQSTGTSWMRSPRRSARTSSSVSKNHAVVLDQRQQRSARSRRIALKPHCASENPVRNVACRIGVVAARDELSLRAADDPRAAREPGTDREVAVTRHAAARPAEAVPRDRWRGRRPCRRARSRRWLPTPPAAPARGLSRQAGSRARRRARAPSRSAIDHVRSVLALSTIVTSPAQRELVLRYTVQPADTGSRSAAR